MSNRATRRACAKRGHRWKSMPDADGQGFVVLCADCLTPKPPEPEKD